MSRRLCAVLLAAGEGTRLRPLTEIRPKALCPVGNVALLDRALAMAASLGLAGPDDVAINAWHLAQAIVAHARLNPSTHPNPRTHPNPSVDHGVSYPFDGVSCFQPGDRLPDHDTAHVAVEHGAAPLGSAGGLAALRDWIDGRDVVVGNADAYLSGAQLDDLTSNWNGEGVRLLGVPAGRHRAEFGAHRFAGISVIPWRYVEKLKIEPTDLVKTVWRPAEAAGELRIVDYGGVYIDCGTPADYLAANLHEAATRGVAGSLVAPGATVTGSVAASVVGPGARVDGAVTRTVVWPDATVAAGEHLTAVIRYGSSPADTVRAD